MLQWCFGLRPGEVLGLTLEALITPAITILSEGLGLQSQGIASSTDMMTFKACITDAFSNPCANRNSDNDLVMHSAMSSAVSQRRWLMGWVVGGLAKLGEVGWPPP